MRFLGIPEVRKVVPAEHILVEKRVHRFSVFFTSGCFDLFHLGHIFFLKRCADEMQKRSQLLPLRLRQPACLVVGVNSDRSLEGLKGHLPVEPEMDRAVLVACQPEVGYVAIFRSLTPKQLIHKLKPDVILHGDSSDRPAWGPESMDELDRYEGEVVRIPIEGLWSTSNLLSRCQELNDAASE